MFDAFVTGLLLVLQWKTFLYLLIGAAIGFWVGILPGLGGGATLALMIPFIYRMTPQEALPFLLGMHSVVQTTGDITSILFGVPGEATTVATIVDGYPMAKKGEAGRALGAALMSSLVGAVVGAGFLAISIPIVRPLVLAFGSPEMFMVIILGLTCISTLSGRGRRGLLLGLMSGGLGFICSLVGQDRQAGILRFTFGQLYLWNGLSIIPVVIGLFAIPEIVDLAVRGTAIAGSVTYGKLGKGVREGVIDTFRHFWLTVRCSLVGTFIGILPGLGGGVAQWVSYAHATQSAKTPEDREKFGKGDVRGVLGPGAANNSKEGAGLIPTVAFGIPASSGMAILMGAFLLLGLVPGPDMLTKHLPLTFSMVWTIVVANIVVVAVSLLFINHIANLTTIRGSILIPFILLLCFIGAYTANNHIGDLIVVLVFGVVGYFMVRFGWPRPPFILGFILGELAETYLYVSTTRYGAAWLYRPKVIIILLLAIGVALYPFIQRKRFDRKAEGELDEV
jgi:putative tricarboxylic transport membrane protein